MYGHKFNFVRRQPKLKFGFVERQTRVAGGSLAPRGITQAARSLLITAAVFIVFAFSVNLIAKYAFEKLDVKGFTLEILPFAKAKYFISKDNMYTVYDNGKVEFVDKNVDSVSLPFLTGIDPKDARAGRGRALKMALALDRKYLRNISEINVGNPDNIVFITLDGKKGYLGDELTNEKMDNYYTSLDRITRSYSTVDLRYKDRVIIK
jgi:hypothetical protein